MMERDESEPCNAARVIRSVGFVCQWNETTGGRGV